MTTQTKPTLPATQGEKLKAITAILDAIVESIAVAGNHGAPGGVLYSALMASGCTLNQFQQLMGILVNSGRVTLRGQCYFTTPRN